MESLEILIARSDAMEVVYFGEAATVRIKALYVMINRLIAKTEKDDLYNVISIRNVNHTDLKDGVIHPSKLLVQCNS